MSDRFLDGRLDEFYFWNRAITESEVQRLYDDFYTPAVRIMDTQSCEEVSVSVTDSLTDVVWSTVDIGSTLSVDESGTYDCYEVRDTFAASIEKYSPRPRS